MVDSSTHVIFHEILEKEVYMLHPPRFVDSSNHIMLIAIVYLWTQVNSSSMFHWLSSFLHNLGFQGSIAGSSLLILHTIIHSVYLLVYVDDIIHLSSPNVPFSTLVSSLSKGLLHYFLGIEVRLVSISLCLT